MKCKIEVNENVQRELTAKLKLICIVMFVLGCVGFLTYISLFVFLGDSFYLYILLIISSLMFGFGLVYLLTIARTKKKQMEHKIVAEYEIFEDHIIEKITRDGEDFSTAKYNYKQFAKIKETQNYLFLFPNKFSALAVPKNQLSQNDFEQLKTWIQNQRTTKWLWYLKGAFFALFLFVS